jgi:hypothetical protein
MGRKLEIKEDDEEEEDNEMEIERSPEPISALMNRSA